MRVREVMMGTPYYCQPETNLGSATELMWNANCGFLPVETADGKVIGVLTDRDVCIALGTRSRLASDIGVGEVMSGKLSSCAPSDDIHVALQTMKEEKVRRLPVSAQKGALVGVLSMDDIRTLVLPEGVNVEKLTAEYVNGVVEITTPVAAAALPRKIEVKTMAPFAKQIAA
jgi:CBS domain-containing protein